MKLGRTPIISNLEFYTKLRKSLIGLICLTVTSLTMGLYLYLNHADLFTGFLGFIINYGWMICAGFLCFCILCLKLVSDNISKTQEFLNVPPLELVEIQKKSFNDLFEKEDEIRFHYKLMGLVSLASFVGSFVFYMLYLAEKTLVTHLNAEGFISSTIKIAIIGLCAVFFITAVISLIAKIKLYFSILYLDEYEDFKEK